MLVECHSRYVISLTFSWQEFNKSGTCPLRGWPRTLVCKLLVIRRGHPSNRSIRQRHREGVSRALSRLIWESIWQGGLIVRTTKCRGVLALGLLALLATSPVHADTTYTYTGTPYTSCFGTYTCTSTGPLITIRFDTRTPLPANLPFASITLDVLLFSFHMSDGIIGLGGADNIFVDAGTDANGNINQWDIGGFPACSPCGERDLTSFNVGGQSVDSSEVFDVHGTLVGGGETLSGPGTWTVPEPSSLILLGAGLLGLALIGVRR